MKSAEKRICHEKRFKIPFRDKKYQLPQEKAATGRNQSRGMQGDHETPHPEKI